MIEAMLTHMILTSIFVGITIGIIMAVYSITQKEDKK